MSDTGTLGKENISLLRWSFGTQTHTRIYIHDRSSWDPTKIIGNTNRPPWASSEGNWSFCHKDLLKGGRLGHLEHAALTHAYNQ